MPPPPPSLSIPRDVSRQLSLQLGLAAEVAKRGTAGAEPEPLFLQLADYLPTGWLQDTLAVA